MMNDWSYSFRWTQPYPTWPTAQLGAAQAAVQAELERMDALEQLVQTADLAPIANLLKSLGKKS
jgi:hypothetical protein